MFLFSSEIKEHCCSQELCPEKINQKVIGDILLIKPSIPETFINMFYAHAGHCMTINASGINIERYWHIVENTDFFFFSKKLPEVYCRYQ